MTEINPNLPQSVRDAAANADRLLREIGATPADQNAPPVPPAPSAPAAPASPQPAPPTVPQAPGTPPAAAPADEGWEHRYKSEKGRRERAEQQVRDLTQETENLRRVLAASSAARAPTPAVAPALADDDRLTEDEERDYGPDMLRVVGKQAKAVIAQVTAPLQAEIASLKQQLSGLGGYVEQDSKAKFLADLERLTSGKWQALNRDDAFLDWLDERDPYAGVTRHTLLSDAQAAGDAARAAKFFTGFLAQREATTPPAAAPGANPPADPAGDGRLTLDDLAAPGRAKGAGTATPAEKPIWSNTEIAKFFDDVRRGVFAGRDAEKQRLERDIIAAAGEGRIRNG